MGLEEVDVRMLRRGIGTLTPPRESGAPAVVLKLLGRHTCVTGPGTGQARGVPRTEVCVACHEALSEANVAVPLLARTADFIVEPRGWLRGWGAGAAETCVDNARLAQRLHATSTEWFTQSLRQRPGPVPALFPVFPPRSAPTKQNTRPTDVCCFVVFMSGVLPRGGRGFKPCVI